MSDTQALYTDEEAAWIGGDPNRAKIVEKIIEYVQLLKQYKLDPSFELEFTIQEAWEEIFTLRDDHSDLAPQDCVRLVRFLERRLREGVREINEFRTTLQAL